MKLSSLALAAACGVGRSAFAQESSNAGPKAWFDVRQFGAAGDGKAVDTVAINLAIDAVAAAGAGR